MIVSKTTALFTPVTLNITFESAKEYDLFYSMTVMNVTVPSVCVYKEDTEEETSDRKTLSDLMAKISQSLRTK